VPAAAHPLALSASNFVSLAKSFPHGNRIQDALPHGNPHGNSDAHFVSLPNPFADLKRFSHSVANAHGNPDADLVSLPNPFPDLKRFPHADADRLRRVLAIAAGPAHGRAVVLESFGGVVAIARLRKSRSVAGGAPV
jgi:hypothetical protein